MRELYPDDPNKEWKPKLGRFFLGADARIDPSGTFRALMSNAKAGGPRGAMIGSTA